MPLKLSYLDHDANDRRKQTFSRHERRVSAALGGVRTLASGALGMKGDVWAGDRNAGQRIMVECKATERESFTLKIEWLDKLVKEARQASHEPVLAIRHQASGHAFDYAFVPLDRWLTLTGRQPPEVDVVVLKQQATLSASWLAARFLDAEPAAFYFKAVKHTTPRGWVLERLDTLKEYYEREAARLKAPLL